MKETTPWLELVVFDCDGVLVDSERLAVKVESRLIGDLGWPLGEADVVDRFVGRSDAYMQGEIERHVGRRVPDWQERYESMLHAAFREELTAVEGIVEVLDKLGERGIATCVASSGTHDKMRLTLGLTDLYHRFEGRIYSATQVSDGKPAPDLFLFAADQMGVPPNRCIVVEDSPSGVQAARAAGMRCIAYAGVGGLVDEALLTGPGTTVVRNLAEVVEVVDNFG